MGNACSECGVAARMLRPQNGSHHGARYGSHCCASNQSNVTRVGGCNRTSICTFTIVLPIASCSQCMQDVSNATGMQQSQIYGEFACGYRLRCLHIPALGFDPVSCLTAVAEQVVKGRTCTGASRHSNAKPGTTRMVCNMSSAKAVEPARHQTDLPRATRAPSHPTTRSSPSLQTADIRLMDAAAMHNGICSQHASIRLPRLATQQLLCHAQPCTKTWLIQLHASPLAWRRPHQVTPLAPSPMPPRVPLHQAPPAMLHWRCLLIAAPRWPGGG